MQPAFIAHRGYATAFPENTLLAIDAAREAGTHLVEVDVQLSKDRVPVLFHDRDLQRLCGQPGAIHDYTYAELQSFYVSDREKFADRFADNRITSLAEFLHYLKKYPYIKAFVELKRSMIEQFSEQTVWDVLMPMFACLHEQVTFISYSFPILEKVHHKTIFPTGIVVDHWQEIKQAHWLPEWIFCDSEGLPEDDAELQTASKIAVFEVSDKALAEKLLQRGIGYLETFRIREMLEAFPAGKKE